MIYKVTYLRTKKLLTGGHVEEEEERYVLEENINYLYFWYDDKTNTFPYQGLEFKEDSGKLIGTDKIDKIVKIESV